MLLFHMSINFYIIIYCICLLNKFFLYKGHIVTYSIIKSKAFFIGSLLISLVLLIDIEEKFLMDAYGVPNQDIYNKQTSFQSQSITNSPGSTSSQFPESFAINSYNLRAQYSTSNVNQMISGEQYTNQLQKINDSPNSINNQFVTNTKSNLFHIFDNTNNDDNNILTTVLQQSSGNQLIEQIQKVNLASQSNNQQIAKNDKQNQAFVDDNDLDILTHSNTGSQTISQEQNIIESLLNELRSQENVNKAINSYVPFDVNNNDINNIDLFKYISQANIAQDQCTSDPNCFLHGKNDVLIEAEEEGENNEFSNKISQENLKTSTCEGMKECNTIEIGIGNALAEIENSFNVIVNQRLQQYNECITNSKCENIATIYGNIENSNNIELNENLIQNNFCTFGSNCMNIGRISSETLMEEAKTIILELTQENKCKNQATCINEFNMDDLDTTSNYQKNICIGGTCINTGINSRIISNHADCLNSGIDTTMICNKKVQITKSPEKISVSKTFFESKN